MKKQKGLILGIMLVISLAVILIVLLLSLLNKDKSTQDNSQKQNNSESQDVQLDDAMKAGQELSHGKCEGEGPVELTALPMNKEDFAILIPYGLVTSGHVTPIDHQYFSPTIFNSPRDTYEVYAPADARIVDIGARPRVNPDNPNDKFEEYRIVFSHTCTFLTYFDLVTSLAPDLKAEYDKNKDANGYAGNIDFPVKAGQMIGKIGGQTLDFAVWDTQKPLTGFVVPEHYEAESWKLYTANPNDYFSSDLVEILKAKNPRTTEPVQGKIDYDIDGKLIGNWFLEGTNGYAGSENYTGGTYWSGHLSIAPNLYDPTRYIFSTGDFEGEAKQFLIFDENIDPKKIDTDSGLIKFNIGGFSYVDSQGKQWIGTSYTKGPKITESGQEQESCVLVQLIENRKLKLETFSNQSCDSINKFSLNAKIYER